MVLEALKEETEPEKKYPELDKYAAKVKAYMVKTMDDGQALHEEGIKLLNPENNKSDVGRLILIRVGYLNRVVDILRRMSENIVREG